MIQFIFFFFGNEQKIVFIFVTHTKLSLEYVFQNKTKWVGSIFAKYIYNWFRLLHFSIILILVVDNNEFHYICALNTI